MNTRVPFLQRKSPRFWGTFIASIITCVIVIGLVYQPLETIVVGVVVIIGIILVGIINKSTDDLEQAKNWRNPVPLDKVLSFSLEKEMREKKA